MDALIRSAQLAPSRTRLSETRAVMDAAHARSASERATVEALSAQVEQELRAQVTAQAQKVYEAERKRAHSEGYAAGLAEAKLAAEETLTQQRQSIQTRVDTFLSALEQAHGLALSNLEASAGEIAFAAICRLVGHNAATPAFVLGLVEQACTQLRGDEVATVRLHPRDIDLLGELLHGEELRVRSFNLKVIADESLALGGCVLDAPTGQYDAALDGQLSRLHELLVAGSSAKSGGSRAMHGNSTRD